MPIKPLSFKGDAKKAKKRKQRSYEEGEEGSRRAEDGGTTMISSMTTTGSSNVTADPSSDDSWTTPDVASDVAGPTILILATQPPTCLASDAHGNIFASPVENIFESHLETVEPHDVRQVWVASAVAGTADGQISLKASHGGYLSCDGIGVLGARREARGVEEGFVLEQIPPLVEAEEALVGRAVALSVPIRYRLRTAAGSATDKGKRYLVATTTTTTTEDQTTTKTHGKKREPDVNNANNDDENEKDDRQATSRNKKISISLRGDGEAGDAGTEVVVKMQARFKPRLQMSKATKAREKVSRQELEHAAGRKLTDDEVRRLKRAKRDGSYYEQILDVRAKSKHDKFAS